MTWTKKSAVVTVSWVKNLKKLQLAIDTQSPMQIKPDSFTYPARREQRGRFVLQNRPETLQEWYTTRRACTIRGLVSLLRCEQRAKFSTPSSCGEQDGGHPAQVAGGLHVHTDRGGE